MTSTTIPLELTLRLSRVAIEDNIKIKKSLLASTDRPAKLKRAWPDQLTQILTGTTTLQFTSL